MQGLWDSSTVPLLEVFQELNHGSFAEPNFIRAAENGVLSVAPSWPGALSRLRGLGVALLQDLPWWGPVMERRLRDWPQDACSFSSSDRPPQVP